MLATYVNQGDSRLRFTNASVMNADAEACCPLASVDSKSQYLEWHPEFTCLSWNVSLHPTHRRSFLTVGRKRCHWRTWSLRSTRRRKRPGCKLRYQSTRQRACVVRMGIVGGRNKEDGVGIVCAHMCVCVPVCGRGNLRQEKPLDRLTLASIHAGYGTVKQAKRWRPHFVKTGPWWKAFCFLAATFRHAALPMAFVDVQKEGQSTLVRPAIGSSKPSLGLGFRTSTLLWCVWRGMRQQPFVRIRAVLIGCTRYRCTHTTCMWGGDRIGPVCR